MNATEETSGVTAEDNSNTNAVVIETDDVVDDLAEEIELMSIDKVIIYSSCNGYFFLAY